MPFRCRLSLIVFSGDFDRVHYALAMACAAAATDRPVSLLFAGRSLHFFLAQASDGTPGWAALNSAETGKSPIERNEEFKNSGIGTIEELALACVDLNVSFYRCDMGVKATKLDASAFRTDFPIQIGSLVSFLSEAEKEGSQIIFI
jgi:peroxiredoxin family protein